MKEALTLALEALESIALAGMSPSPEMSDGHIDAWHARQAWRFIGIAARALDPIKEALAQPPLPAQEPVAWEQFHEHLVERNFCPRCGKRTADIHTCTPPQ